MTNAVNAPFFYRNALSGKIILTSVIRHFLCCPIFQSSILWCHHRCNFTSVLTELLQSWSHGSNGFRQN